MNRRDALKTDVAKEFNVPVSKLFPMPTHTTYTPVGNGQWAAVLSMDADFVTLGRPMSRDEVIRHAATFGYEPVFLDETAFEESA